MSTASALAGALVGATALSVHAALGASRAARVRDRLPCDGSAGPATSLRLPPPPAWLPGALERGGLPWPAAAAWRAWLAAGGAAVVASLVVGGVPLAAVAAVVAIFGPRAALRACSGRGDRVLQASLPVLLEQVARSLRSGGTLLGALDEAATGLPVTLAVDVRSVVREVEAGASLPAALERWGERRRLPAVTLVVAALALGAETGGAQAQALDGLATTLRDRLAVAAEVRALSSQARLSALVITLAPLGFALFAASADPRSAEFLLRTPLGLACLSVGLALDAAAAWWMHRLTRQVG